MNILKWWPTPNIDQPAGQAYNYESVDPETKLLGYQPVIRVDYQPTSKLRGSFKFVEYQPSKVHPGTIPGFNDTQEHDYGIWLPAGTFNWTMSNTMFLEASFGANFHHQEGCSVIGGEPNYCRTGLSVTSAGNRNLSGFGDIPTCFPTGRKYSIQKRSPIGSSIRWTRPCGTAPDSGAAAVCVGHTRRQSSTSERRTVWRQSWCDGRHELHTRHTQSHVECEPHQSRGTAHDQTGYYYFRSLQRRGAGNVTGNISFANDANNPLDTTFGFSNAAIGVFSTGADVTVAGRRASGGHHEAFAQDNWHVNSRFSLDYGVRFAHMQPQYDSYATARTSFPSNGRRRTRRGCMSRGASTTSIPVWLRIAERWIP